MTVTGRFSNRVRDYVSGRPGYPDAVVSWLAETFDEPVPRSGECQ